jgi:diguanylate cyclase (GGDEF)-like protein
MFKRSLGERDPDAVFRPKIGQLGLLLFALMGIVLFGYFSIASQAAQDQIRTDLYAQETDSTALSFTQREAFNLAFVLAEWGSDGRSSRDVQIARALLGQRLGVVISDGVQTASVVPEAFMASLEELDQIILSLQDLPVNERVEILRAADPKINSFLSQTRLLSEAFQESSRSAIEDAIDANDLAQLQLIITFILVAVALLGAFTWIAIDIDRGYRRVKRKIQVQQEELSQAVLKLSRTQQVDLLASKLIQQVSDGISIDQILNELGPAFSELLPGIDIDVAVVGPQRGAVNVIANAESQISSDELNTCMVRIREVVAIALGRESAEKQIDEERQHDSLTGLPNRSILTEETQGALDECRDRGGVAAIFLIDIDRFRDFNNALGNASGDVLLIEVADRLRNSMIGSEVAARLSGDEYAVVGRFHNTTEANTRAKQLFNELHFTTLAGATETNVTVSMGVAISDSQVQGQSAADLQRSAAMAIYLAKEADRSGFIVFSQEEHAALSDRLADELAVRNALRNGEFKLFYQPIMQLSNNRPVGVEALIRWERPGFGILTPDAFLETTRRAGILNELSLEIIDEALGFWSRILVKSFDIGHNGMPYVSINIDPVQLEDPLFSEMIIGAARRKSVPMAAIVLEVTEHVLSESETAVNQLEKLRRIGVRIALDDFGTGYSALGQAQHLPLDILKIDKSFIPADQLTGRDRRLVSDIHAIAGTLGLSTTAEGVESTLVSETLRELGVQFAQGYLYSKALPEDEIIRWMQQYSSLSRNSS